ncbi:MAG TPA: hypothetical protein VIU29_01425 [Candidatus Deferrimicrobiaceae bacterium]
MENDVQARQEEAVETFEVLDEGQVSTDELMACCKAGAQSARA